MHNKKPQPTPNRDPDQKGVDASDARGDVCNLVLDRIESEQISPKAKWTYSAHEYLLWGVGTILLIGGGIAFSVMLYMLSENDWDLYEKGGGTTAQLLLASAPYLWIVLLAGFILLARRYVRDTKKGYKIQIGMVTGGAVVFSIVLGSVFYTSGVGELVDHAFEERVPAYAKFLAPRHHIWDRPEDGLLTGVVIEIEEVVIEIEDTNGEVWEVVIEEHVPVYSRREHADLMPGVLVRLIGEIEDEDTFWADEVRILPKHPFGPKGKKGIKKQLKQQGEGFVLFELQAS